MKKNLFIECVYDAQDKKPLAEFMNTINYPQNSWKWSYRKCHATILSSVSVQMEFLLYLSPSEFASTSTCPEKRKTVCAFCYLFPRCDFLKMSSWKEFLLKMLCLCNFAGAKDIELWRNKDKILLQLWWHREFLGLDNDEWTFFIAEFSPKSKWDQRLVKRFKNKASKECQIYRYTEIFFCSVLSDNSLSAIFLWNQPFQTLSFSFDENPKDHQCGISCHGTSYSLKVFK